MKLKNILVLFVISAMVIGCCCTGVCASVNDNVVLMNHLEYEPSDRSLWEHWEDRSITRAYGDLNLTISQNNGMTIESSFKLNVGDTITYDCTYTPKNASVDFGFFAPDGYFYYFNCTTGSINKTFRVSQQGSYTLAIYNNSNEAVTVTGTVNY